MESQDSGVLTNQAMQAINSMVQGSTQIKYTHMVFSSDDNSQATPDSLKSMTDLNSKDIVVEPETIDTGDLSANIRGYGVNDNLTQGTYIKTIGLYASIDGGNEFLFEIKAKQHGSYLPAHSDSGNQTISEEFQILITTASNENVQFTDDKAIWITKTDLDNAMQDVVHKTDLDNAMQDVVHESDLNDIRQNFVPKVVFEEATDNISKEVTDSTVHKTGNEQIAGTKDYTNRPTYKGQGLITANDFPELLKRFSKGK